MDHRSSYRVRYPVGYPPALMPRVMIEPGQKVELEDWSENGLRIRLPAAPVLAVGDVINLSILLPEEEPIGGEGTVIWMDEHYAAIQLASSTLPWRILLGEQRAIARWKTRLVEVRNEEAGS